MTAAAPRIPYELVQVIRALDDGTRTIAEIWRCAGDAAETLRLAQPSYQQVRVIVHEVRGRAWDGATLGSAARVALEVALRLRAPEAFVEHVASRNW